MLKELLRPLSEADYDVSYANYVNITAVENMSVQFRSAQQDMSTPKTAATQCSKSNGHFPRML